MPDDNVRSAQMPLVSNAPADHGNEQITRTMQRRTCDIRQALVTEWLQRAIVGIRDMHQDENLRQRVALRLF
ncbi:hypothetical protein [Paraburkholderia sp. MM6662-R1]|uniref:hypothetical protein n=1 Tax=Paraburkholderia sp. MM6662-R1 TaxID=2991066 RepID=UPI003D19EF05